MTPCLNSLHAESSRHYVKLYHLPAEQANKQRLFINNHGLLLARTDADERD